MGKRELSGKVIVITGGSSGIGRATAIAAAIAGMDVVIAGRKQARLEQTAHEIQSLGRNAHWILCDVRSDDDVQRLIDQTVERFGRLDVMFANAGHGLFASIERTTAEQTQEIFDVNFNGTLRCVQKCLPVMRKLGGLKHVIICSSSVSEIGLPMFGVYCATKAAQDSIASALRAEVAHEGITVSSLHPIGTRSEFFDRTRDAAGGAEVPFNTPPGLMQTPEHVAKCVVAAVRRPRPEIWPHFWTRIGMAIVTAVPYFNAMSMRKIMQKMRTSNASVPTSDTTAKSTA